MDHPVPRSRRPRPAAVVAALLALLLAAGLAAGWWLGSGRPVPAAETARARAWQGTDELLDAPALGTPAADERLRADLRTQREAFGPAPDERAAAAADRPRSPAPAPRPDTGSAPGGAGAPAGAAGLLAASARDLAGDALTVPEPATARVLGSAAAARAVGAAHTAGGPAAPLCDPGRDGDGTGPAAVLWSALDRAVYALPALAARGTGPDGAPAVPVGAADGLRELLAVPPARAAVAADPGLRAGAYVLPPGWAQDPAAAAVAVAEDVQAAAAHVLGRGGTAQRCWALESLRRAAGLEAGLTGAVDALPGIVREDPAGP
ncbi:hypothetical protein AS188_08345 [Kocuria flava]|uniref:DUF4439 domain-containing protein n=1 Tax=Kocuria flava TaxID=446860 RepID=A0A0U3HWG3_9MICC|nr:hypothetical protein [Kocuria flava]ALU39759.1 hypothetical protein AS188_08345 [Kocuria flava]GEO92559.1 hypothetical protein KFL01_18650 [Kocuria flava]